MNIKLRRPGKNSEALLKAAGFREPTSLQKQYISAASQNRDLIVESFDGEGKTIAQLLPLVSASKTRKKGVTGLMLTDSVDSLEKYEREFRKFPVSATRGKTLVTLGKTDQPKKELKILSRHPAIIVGTTERIIDHIRRNNIDLSNDTTVVVNIPENKERIEFNRDVEFILTKMPNTRAVSLFTGSKQHVESLEYLLKRPITLTAEERSRELPTVHLYKGELLPPSLLEIFYAYDLYRVLLLVDTNHHAQLLLSYFQEHGISSRLVDKDADTSFEDQKEAEAESFRCTISTFGCVRNIDLHYRSIFIFGFPDEEAFFVELGQAVAGFPTPPEISVIIPPGKFDQFTSLQEKYQMSTKNEHFPEKDEVLEGQLKSIVKIIKEEENPDILNKYKKMIKKSVPFSMRGYLSAYLFKKMVEGETPDVLQAGDSEKQTIFVSIGKNRKVFPKDLVRLFRSKVDLQDREIGNIKVLDNYSFIDIPKSKAKQAIDTMDNMSFKGRNITVNFARKKSPQKGNRIDGKTTSNKDGSGRK
ncbi:MAG: DbpA RNA binding domain-containing protein [Spirochaetaceae bacterium]